jgi:hypothetical protein
MKKTFYLILLFCLINGWGWGQTIDLEKTYEITGKSKRGALANVEFDKDQGYTLTYVIKSNEKMAKFQIYTFDKDFNFNNMVEDEQEFEKAKVKYKWFRYRGEEYSVEGIFVEPTVTGALVLRKKMVSFKYDWLFLGYYTTTKVLDKVKPRSADGSSYFYYAHAEDDVTGEVSVLVGDKSIKEVAGINKHFKILRFDQNLDIVKENKFDMEFPQSLAFSKNLYKENPDDPDNPLFGGMVFVFAPMGGQGFNKYANQNKCAYSYIRVDENLDIVDNIPFNSYASFWKIDDVVCDANNNVYLYGPSKAGTDKYFNQIAGNQNVNVVGFNMSVKYKAVQLMKIANHQVAYFTETTLEDFAAKLKKPASQKKAPEYEGKKFEIANYLIASNNDFFVVGQNYNPNKEGGKNFTDVIGMQFDDKGILKSQYGIDTKESNKYSKTVGAPQNLFPASDGQSLYWLMFEVRGVTFYKHKPLTYPRIGKIDLANGNVSDFLDVRGPDDDYYLDAKFPYIENEESNMITFFGSDKPGKKIWFVRIKI